MIRTAHLRGFLGTAVCVALMTTSCAFQGLNSLPLPGAVGRGPDAHIYRVEVANVGTLESNSPVMIDDVIVGSVGKMTVQGWHANLEISVQPDVVVPANAVASVGQTSLLGSMHVELNPPPGEAPSGRLEPGATIPLDKTSTYPSTEETLASLSLVINTGGLAQLGDIVHNLNGALSGRQQQVRELLTRLDTFVGTLDDQHDNIVASIRSLNRLAGTFAGKRDVLTEALEKIPPALDVLIAERPQITTALEKLGDFSDTATRLVNESKADLVKNLQNLEPTVRALADVGPNLATVIAYATHYPFSQGLIDRGVKGDYMNLWAVVDFTRERLKPDPASRHPLRSTADAVEAGAGRPLVHPVHLRSVGAQAVGTRYRTGGGADGCRADVGFRDAGAGKRIACRHGSATGRNALAAIANG